MADDWASRKRDWLKFCEAHVTAIKRDVENGAPMTLAACSKIRGVSIVQFVVTNSTDGSELDRWPFWYAAFSLGITNENEMRAAIVQEA